MLASLGVNLAVALLLFFADGRHEAAAPASVERVPACPADAARRPRRPARVGDAQEGAGYGDAEARARPSGTTSDSPSGRRAATTAGDRAERSRAVSDRSPWSAWSRSRCSRCSSSSTSASCRSPSACVLSLIAPNLQKRALGQVSWPEIMLIVGVSTYVGVLDKMGTIDFVGAQRRRPHLAADGRAAAVLRRRRRLGVRLVDRGARLADPAGRAVPAGRHRGRARSASSRRWPCRRPSSTSARSRPTARSCSPTRRASTATLFFRQLLVYGALVTVVAPVVVWLLFVVSVTRCRACHMNAHRAELEHARRTTAPPGSTRAAARSAALPASASSGRSRRRAARSGDRAGRPRLPRRQQPEAGRLPGATRWRGSIRRAVHDLHMVQSVLALPRAPRRVRERHRVAARLLVLRPARRAARQARRARADRRSARSTPTSSCSRRYFVDLTPQRRAGRGAGGRSPTATSTPARTPKTRRPSSRRPRSSSGIVIAQVNEIVDARAARRHPGDWVDFVIASADARTSSSRCSRAIRRRSPRSRC